MRDEYKMYLVPSKKEMCIIGISIILYLSIAYIMVAPIESNQTDEEIIYLINPSDYDGLIIRSLPATSYLDEENTLRKYGR
jgi:hypothetical protein